MRSDVSSSSGVMPLARVGAMVGVSRETPDETERRLRGVIAASELSVLDGAWSFQESSLLRPPDLTPEILAVVRDDEVWSWLAPADGSAPEQFALFSFHFPPGLDNSGFVGWLASALKQRLGTGVFVVCGQNSTRGGIFDHWGCPVHLRDEALAVIDDLRGVR